MGMLTGDMKRAVQDQRLGFVATVCRDGTPNLSPKGTTAVWDDDHLIFGDIRSPQTMENLRHNPAIEINIVDVFLRKGYRFKGRAEILSNGPLYEEIHASYPRRGINSPIGAVVLMKVEQAAPLISPAYDEGASEDEVRTRWEEYWDSVRQARDERTAPEPDRS